jgi:hypothetical protein
MNVCFRLGLPRHDLRKVAHPARTLRPPLTHSALRRFGCGLTPLAFCLALFNLADAQDLRFTTCVRTTNGMALSWTNSVAGQAYTLQSRDGFTNRLWLTLDAPKPWPTLQTQWNATLSPAQPMRLYRVIAVQPAMRGKLLSSSLMRTYSTNELSFYLSAYGLTAQYAVGWYKVIYETIDPLGGRTTASGGLFLPQQTGKDWPLLSFSHGTTTLTNSVASNNGSGDYWAGLVFACNGYATVLPDYLGMGASPGFHPYLHARSEATAGVDMLRAARD